jgi:hypothetical protein
MFIGLLVFVLEVALAFLAELFSQNSSLHG